MVDQGYDLTFNSKGCEIIKVNLGRLITVIGKTSVYSELLVPLRRVVILETKKLKSLVFSFMRYR